MKGTAAAVLGVIFMSAGAAGAQAQDAAARTEVPIKQTLRSNGRIYYSVPVSIGGSAPFDAMLDTGSTGLRVLPGPLAAGNTTLTDKTSITAYGSGTILRGVTADAVVTLGGVSSASPVAIQLVQSVGCLDRRRECPSANMAAENFGIAGYAPGEGYKAIMGTSLEYRYSNVANPLTSIGSGTWIVELPRPGDAAPGKLILNPSALEVAGFTLFHPGNGNGTTTIPGCLFNENTQKKICGRMLLDSGAPEIVATGPGIVGHITWDDGAKVLFAVQNEEGVQLATRFTVDNSKPSPYNFFGANAPGVVNRIVGVAPFFAFDVYFDGKHGVIGLKER